MVAKPSQFAETSEVLDENTTVTYEEIYYGKVLCRITTIATKDPERVQRANDFVVRCLLNRLPELLA